MRFKKLNDNIHDILLSVVGNQNLCKLIHLPNPVGQPDIEDAAELLFKKIYPLPKVPDVTDTAANFLNIYFADFQLSNSNVGIKSGVLYFDVICHIDQWRIAGQSMLRPLMILNEIDEMVNNQRIAGITKAQFKRVTPLFANAKFVGYRLSYEITSGN